MTLYMSWRSVFGGVGKKISLSSSTLSSGSEKVSLILGFFSISIIIIAFSSRFLAHFASLYIPCWNCNTSLMHYRCTYYSAFLIMRLFWFLTALYIFQLFLVYL